ncbi:hypothetical protein PLESTB_001753800 [Pleodorina starrii]|uniref:Uncharacterized protein n=1 Tax=Pleodorina starrii TaxID=330485 RepID=A0A9W6FA83_9CHLO|nr:hypothetical protein PLESTM_000595700 [Pleodorina starrii]GLC61411.1 hypothetical protein PLESTB_001753800 [Pleodorina starrii]GLC74057.1 hypothetical protein PLESTF_001455300 [Pleodorina starrii]
MGRLMAFDPIAACNAGSSMGLPSGVFFEGSVATDSGGECRRLGRRGSRRFGSGDRCRQLLEAETALHATTAAVCSSSWNYYHRNDAWVHHVLVFSERMSSDGSESLARVDVDGRRWTRLPGHMLQGVKRAARSVGLFRDQLATKLSGICALVLEQQESDKLWEHGEESVGKDVLSSRLRAAVGVQRHIASSSKSMAVEPADILDVAATADRSVAMGPQSTTKFAASAATTVDLLDIDDLDSEEMEEAGDDRCLALESVYTSTADVSGCCSAASAATPLAGSPTCTTISSLPRSSFSFGPLATGQPEERRARPGDERASGWMARSLKTEVSRYIGACSGSAAGAHCSVSVQAAVAETSDGLPARRLAFPSARPIAPLSLNETEGPRVVEEASCVGAGVGAGTCSMHGTGTSPSVWAPLMPQWRSPVHGVELLMGDCDAGGDHKGVVRIELSPAK